MSNSLCHSCHPLQWVSVQILVLRSCPASAANTIWVASIHHPVLCPHYCLLNLPPTYVSSRTQVKKDRSCDFKQDHRPGLQWGSFSFWHCILNSLHVAHGFFFFLFWPEPKVSYSRVPLDLFWSESDSCQLNIIFLVGPVESICSIRLHGRPMESRVCVLF